MYRYPSSEERNHGGQLEGSRIEIYWDGDNVYYPGTVIRFDADRNIHIVLYDNDDSNEYYEEDLRSSSWRLWDDNCMTDGEDNTLRSGKENKIDADMRKIQNRVAKIENKKLSYSGMVVEAVYKLSEKNGSSLQSIRKFIVTNFNLRPQQTASFNALTLKAINNCVGEGLLERNRNTFKLTALEKERRKLKEKLRPGDSEQENTRKEDMLSRFSLYGSILESNQALRKVWEESISHRDKYLIERSSYLEPFLPQKNYFSSRHRNNCTGEEEASIVEKETVLLSPTALLIDEEPYIPNVDVNENYNIIDDKATINKEHINGAIDSCFQNFEVFSPPLNFLANLHDYQIQGISWMLHMFRHGMPMILADQMGLGKTVQSIGFLASLKYQMNCVGPHLIVVPLSVLSNWISEIEKFCPSLRTVRFHGPKDERIRIKSEELGDIREFDVVVTTFEMLVSEANFFRRKYMWSTIIVDEGHRLKNDRSQLSEKLRMVPTICKVILTGTPLQNNLRELWALLHFLAPEIFTTHSAQYFNDGFDLLRNKVDTQILRNARKLLSVFMLRRLKDQVSIKLPSKKEITLLVSLTEAQKELYKQLLCGLDKTLIEIVMKESVNDSSDELVDDNDQSSRPTSEDIICRVDGNTNERDQTGTPSLNEWRRLMNLLLQLRKVCNHVYLMQGVSYPDEISEEIVSGSGKLLLLDRILPRLRQDNHRVLIFSQFTSMLDILEDYCDLRQWPFVRLDGNTNRVQRRLDVRRFNAPESQLFIFLISTRAGGLGLNLASADTVILYDSDWNPQVDIQAMERVHRIGQTKPVRIYRLVCRGSVEERMVSRADKKLFLNAMVAEADPDTEISEDETDLSKVTNVNIALGVQGPSITKRELASLIRFGANAIIDSTKTEDYEINDSHLDLILERNGREFSCESDVFTSNPCGGFESMDKMGCVNNRLEEIDLRQLGNLVYNKKKHQNFLDESLSVKFVEGKRKRIERIKLVDGKGSGYGGAIPVLLSNTSEEILIDKPSVLRRRCREWTHQLFCCLCGKKDDEGAIKCAHCPHLFHLTCLNGHRSVWKGSGMFICPRHKCAGCNRNTASSGGMLFRCVSCLTSFCEDCLPQDEIESIGRCKALETIGYESKQSYYIKCPACMTFSNNTNESTVKRTKNSVGDVVEDEDRLTDNINPDVGRDCESKEIMNEEESNFQLYPSQLMRVHLEEIREVSPSRTSKLRQQSKKCRSETQLRSSSKNNNKKSQQPKKICYNSRKEERCIQDDENDSVTNRTPVETVALLLSKAEELQSQVFNLTFIEISFKNKSVRTRQWDLIVNKVSKGRYRSSAAFVSDVLTYLEDVHCDLRSVALREAESIVDVDEFHKQIETVEELIDYFSNKIAPVVILES